MGRGIGMIRPNAEVSPKPMTAAELLNQPAFQPYIRTLGVTHAIRNSTKKKRRK
jgi:hypothetical protein